METQQIERCVRLGSRVLIQFADGETMEVTIRGREVDLAAGVISAASPLARGILAARTGDQITYVVNRVSHAVTVLRVLDGEAQR